ncbi:MAG: M20/M25/M40 family metallo-hydrolase [Elusimicrobia bacterium]|nr:M20/M25/M40 family metallo-hydrolase [Elusimicrobiota bacterium]
MIFTVTILAAFAAAAPDYDAGAKAARVLLAELVAADTTNPPGRETRAVDLAARRLEPDGIAVEKTEFAPGRGNLTARLKGSGKARPLLLLAHIDVVGTADQPWTSPPHELTERDGYLVGRGVEDDLGMAAILVETLRLLKRERTPLRRDVILALTGDEESGGLGIVHLLEKRRGSIDAAFALNEGGALVLDDGGRVGVAEIQVAEKTYQDFTLVARGETGHSSVPKPDNAIYRLARALDRLAKNPPPARLTAATRAYFAGRAKVERGELAAAMRRVAEAKDAPPAEAVLVLEKTPTQAANLRTTCVATMIKGGTRVNALAAEATANVNCRLLPDESPERAAEWLKGVVDDPSVEVRWEKEMGAAAASPVEGEAMDGLRKVIGELYPGVPLIPTVSRGATDSRHLRAAGIPSYGIHPIAMTESDGERAHGIDERIPAGGLRQGLEFFHKLVLELAAD